MAHLCYLGQQYCVNLNNHIWTYILNILLVNIYWTILHINDLKSTFRSNLWTNKRNPGPDISTQASDTTMYRHVSWQQWLTGWTSSTGIQPTHLRDTTVIKPRLDRPWVNIILNCLKGSRYYPYIIKVGHIYNSNS